MLAQLLDDRHAAMWQSVLYGVTGGSGDIVEVAASQIGNVGGRPYWSWYGFSGRVEWSACFVSWCANECGYIEAGAVPKFAACSAGVQWFRSAGLWRDRGYEPRPGDIVFFDWGGGRRRRPTWASVSASRRLDRSTPSRATRATPARGGATASAARRCSGTGRRCTRTCHGPCRKRSPQLPSSKS